MLFNAIFGSTSGLRTTAKQPPQNSRLFTLKKFAADSDASDKIILAQETNRIVDTRTFDNYDLVSPCLKAKARRYNAMISRFNPQNQ